MSHARLAYILPKYDSHSEEHFSHTVRTLEALAQQLDLTVIVKQWSGQVHIEGAERVLLQRRRGPLRLLELPWLLLRARLSGCRAFFTHYSYSGAIAAALVARLTGARAYYWHCGQARQYYPRRWSLRRDVLWKKLGDELPLNLCLHLSHALVTGTERMAAYYASEFGLKRSRIIVIPNDIDLNHFAKRAPDLSQAKMALGLAPDTPVVLFVHRLSPRKGAQYLAEIATRVRQSVADVVFLVVGGGPYEGLVKQQVTALELGEVVRRLGWVPNRDLARYYAAADVFIMPSDEEGFPRVLLEAQAMGVPFVATDVGGVLDIVTGRQAQFVVCKGDMVLFAEKVVALLRDPASRDDLSAEGLANVQPYAVERVAPLFVERILQ
jgi:glycosyltransferase involved in cell wall biosynthesis